MNSADLGAFLESIERLRNDVALTDGTIVVASPLPEGGEAPVTVTATYVDGAWLIGMKEA